MTEVAEWSEPERWVPDAQVVNEVLSSPKSFLHMTRLPQAERAWLVAGLTVRGMTAETIADRTHCSLRLVRTIRSLEITAVCEYVHTQTSVLERDLSAERSEHSVTRRELSDSRRENDRLRGQLEQLLDALTAGEKIDVFPRCGHPKVDWNIYRHKGTDRQGRECLREYCRECNNKRAARYRNRRKIAAQQANHTPRVMILHPEVVASAS